MCPTKERNRDERMGTKCVERKEPSNLGTLSPDPWDFSRRCQSQFLNVFAGAQFFTEPQLGLGPGVGAQVASQQRLILRSGR